MKRISEKWKYVWVLLVGMMAADYGLAASGGDCDGDGTSDAAEIATGAPDCNNNGVPDECELAVSEHEIVLSITVDNKYALYLGTEDVVVDSFGGNATWEQVDTYTNSYVWPIEYFYVVAWSDNAGLQGLLAELTVEGQTLFSGEEADKWQVYATGMRITPWQSPPPTLADLATQLYIANRGQGDPGSTSIGWKPVTVGPANTAASYWPSEVSGISTNSRWMWYDSGGDTHANAPFQAYDHDEYLIFRFPLASAFQHVAFDCNNNDVPDECDIASGFSSDCNNNGVPDECDMESGIVVEDTTGPVITRKWSVTVPAF